MIEIIQNFWVEIAQMGVEHNVNPFLFAVLYFGTIPPYMGSMVWAVKNHKKQKDITLPIISTLFFFVLPGLYIIIFGRNVAWWVYLIIAFIILFGSMSIFQKMKAKIE